jgi:hypothetical protein
MGASEAEGEVMRQVSKAPAKAVRKRFALGKLARKINDEHEAVRVATRRALKHAIAAGELLLEAKNRLDQHGKWLPWLHANCQMPERTAQLYMRLARHASELLAKNATVADLSIRAAVDLLASDKRMLRVEVATETATVVRPYYREQPEPRHTVAVPHNTEPAHRSPDLKPDTSTPSGEIPEELQALTAATANAESILNHIGAHLVPRVVH